MTDEELQAMIDEFDMDQDGASTCISLHTMFSRFFFVLFWLISGVEVT
jgi:Ca2+-binding EF-hand superfamily protein